MNQLQILENNELTREEKLRECDEILQEFKENIREYITTGDKNCQLEDAERDIGRYQNTLKEALHAENVSKDILSSIEAINTLDKLISTEISEMMRDITATIQNHFDTIAVLSQFLMLVSMSKAETATRKLHKEYDRMSEHYPLLNQIAQMIYAHPYTCLEQISIKLSFEPKAVETTIDECEILFNVRSFEKNRQFVSLSSQGYAYVKYLPTRDKKYSQSELDKAIFTNCVGLLEAIQKKRLYKPNINDADMNKYFFNEYNKVKELYSNAFHERDMDREFIISTELINDGKEEDYEIHQFLKNSNSSIG